MAVKDPNAAVKAITKVDPTLDAKIGLEGLKLSFDYFYTPQAAQHGVGWMDQSQWEWTQDLLLATKVIQKKLPVDDYYTNDYLPRNPPACHA